jgi:osmotically-inducible protein OsmY
MDDRDRRMRERDWRRSEDMNRGNDRFSGSEGRSFDDGSQGYEGQGSSGGRDRVFGERESGMSYGGRNAPTPGGGAYGAGGAYGSGEGYRSEYGGSSNRTGGSGGGRDWQDRDYGGVSPAMQQGEYDLERRAERYEREHRGDRGLGERGQYGRGGGRYYGDSGRESIYREEWSQGGRDTGRAPRGYDAGRSGGYSGGTGGYDYERGYGDGGRQRFEGRSWDRAFDRDQGRDYGRDDDRGERWEQRGREMGRDTGDFFRRAGEKVASWFGGGEHETDREYRRDTGFRGMGPKGYKRADERISDEVHERLTDDPWVDASNISVSVSGGEVTLSGTVENREAKHRAERCVEDISGVSHVQNNLRIDRGNPLTSAGSGYGDSVLEHQMRGETGSGDSLTGNALGGTGSTNNEASKTTTGTNGRTTSTSTDTGKSR